MPVNIQIPELGELFQDYRDGIPGDSYGWGPVITPAKIKNLAYHHSVTAQLLSVKKLSLPEDVNDLGDDDLRIIVPAGVKSVPWKNPQTAIKDGDWKKECNVIAQLHLNNGWGGVGYRFIICSNGVVAYVGDLGRGGSAVGGLNDVMFSACFVGDFTKQLPTAAQVHSAHILAKWFLTLAPQYPNLKTWDQVKGHQEFNPTQCPGSAWKTPGDNLYNRIKDDKWQGYPNPQPDVAPAPIPPVPPVNDDLYRVTFKGQQIAALKENPITKIDTLTKSVQDLAGKIAQAKVNADKLKSDLG